MEKGKKMTCLIDNTELHLAQREEWLPLIHQVDLKYLSVMDIETFTSRKRVNKSGIK